MVVTWGQLFEAGNLVFAGGLFEAAERKYMEALDFARQSGDQSWVGDSLRALAKTYMLMDRPQDAEQAAAEAEQVDRAFWGYESQQVADDMYLVAEAKRIGRNLEEARAIFDRTLAARIELFTENNDDVLAVLIRLLWIDLEEGDVRGMLVNHVRQANTVFAQLHPYGGFAKALNVPSLLQKYLDQDMPSEAMKMAERLQRAMRTVLGNSHPETAVVLADCSSIMQVANNQLAALRLKNRSEVMKKTTSSENWLPKPEVNQSIGIEPGAGAAPPVNPNFPANPYPQASPFPPPNPFAAASSGAPPSQQSPTNSFPLPNLFASAPSDTSTPSDSPANPPVPANPSLPPNPFASAPSDPSPLLATPANLNLPASPASPANPTTPINLHPALQKYAPASPGTPAIGHAKIDLSSLTQGGAATRDEPAAARPDLADLILARADIGMSSRQFTLWWLILGAVLGCVSALIYTLSGFGQLAYQSFMLGFLVESIGQCLFLWIMVERHQQDVSKNLADTLEILVSQLQEGISVGESLKFLSQNGPPSIRHLFARTVAALKSGKPMPEALAEMTYYVRAPEMGQMVDRIKISHSGGGGLATELASLAKSCRERQKASGYGKSANSGMMICLCIVVGTVLLPALQMAFLPAAGAATLNSLPALILLMAAFGFALLVAVALLGPKGEKSFGASAQRAAEKLFEWQSRGKLKNDLRRELSEFLDLVIMYVEKGVSLPQAVQQVSKNASGSCPNLCRELQKSVNELKSFKSALPNAFRQIGKQYEVQELIQLGGTLDAAERTRSSVVFQLREQSKALKTSLKYQGTTRGVSWLMVVVIGLYLLASLFGIVQHHK